MRPDEAAQTSVVVVKGFEFFCSTWMSKLSQRLCLNLPNPLSRYIKILSHFFQCVVGFFTDTKTHTQHFLFTRCKCRQYPPSLLGQAQSNNCFPRIDCIFVFDKIS